MIYSGVILFSHFSFLAGIFLRFRSVRINLIMTELGNFSPVCRSASTAQGLLNIRLPRSGKKKRIQFSWNYGQYVLTPDY